MADEMDGLFSFYASHHALRADKVLRGAGYVVALIPGPRELSPNCGVALRFAYARKEDAQSLLAQNRVQIDTVHPYRPRLAERAAPSSLPTPVPLSPEDTATPLSRFARLWGKS